MAIAQMAIAQLNYPTLCYINKDNLVEFLVYLFGGLHIPYFILLTIFCSLMIHETDYYTFRYITLLILSLLGVPLSIASIVGTALKNKYLIFPWLIFGILFVICELVLVIFMSEVGRTGGLVVFIGFSIFYWLWNFQMYLKITKLQEKNYKLQRNQSKDNTKIFTIYNL